MLNIRFFFVFSGNEMTRFCVVSGRMKAYLIRVKHGMRRNMPNSSRVYNGYITLKTKCQFYKK
jgi:hypothetical protein